MPVGILAAGGGVKIRKHIDFIFFRHPHEAVDVSIAIRYTISIVINEHIISERHTDEIDIVTFQVSKIILCHEILCEFIENPAAPFQPESKIESLPYLRIGSGKANHEMLHVEPASNPDPVKNDFLISDGKTVSSGFNKLFHFSIALASAKTFEI